LVAVWFVSLVIFFEYWLRPGHVITPFRTVLNTLLLVYSFLLPAYFFFFVAKMKKVNPEIDVPREWEVAMIVTRSPSEPFYVVKKTLEGMLSQATAHDTWLADEDPSPEIIEWCRQHRVKISCRKNVEAYHRATWPRRTRCKEGNLAYFYDTYGYDNYDFVVQLDADHVPGKGYLKNILKPFVAEEVGYVSAPSITNSNEKLSWSARGRLHAESIMHGPLQAGYSLDYAPLCIGSHYAVRTRALKEIGGLGPELAEDHSTTLMFNAYGWKGVHALDAIASGEGPPSLRACILQEFQWSRSLAIILTSLLPKYWKLLTLKARLQFLFSELWYPIFGFTMLIGYLFPIIAVIQGKAWVSVSYFEFMTYSVPLVISIFGIIHFLKAKGLLRPHTAPLFSMEATVFQIIRWPWALYGTISGIIAGLGGKTPPFKVTKKGNFTEEDIGWPIYILYASLIAFPALVLFFDHGEKPGGADGYYFFIIINQLMYLAVLFYMVLQQKREYNMAILNPSC
ncbi:glycosyltransferase family 2 protein, partial [Zeaxanthinibacter enoshimensis]|uniref:glycosyltransferase family 2 protein n=1 Tax=Zeaxanthinibacter enoshimensis TaxID=392009 RepID=UPI0035623C53